MKQLLTLISIMVSNFIFSQNDEWKTIEYGTKIQIILEDTNAENLKIGDSINIINFSVLNLKNKEIPNSKQSDEKTTYGTGIINSAASLINPEEMF